MRWRKWLSNCTRLTMVKCSINKFSSHPCEETIVGIGISSFILAPTISLALGFLKQNPETFLVTSQLAFLLLLVLQVLICSIIYKTQSGIVET